MKNYLILILFIISADIAEAQNYFGTTPSASGGSIDVQNNLYDGSVIIKIPFFNTSVDGVPIGMNIGYSTKGVTASQMASSIGLGWDFLGVPSIIRTQKDLPDESFSPYMECWESNEHWGGIGGYATGAWFNLSDNYSNYTNDAFSKNQDDELDEFMLNLGSSSIKFQIDRNGNLITIPHNEKLIVKRKINDTVISTANLPLLPPVNTVPYGELTFEVIDGMGNKYFFNKGDYQTLNYKDYTGVDPYEQYAACNEPIFTKINKWVVTKIETYRGNTIFYNYVNFPLSDLVADVNQFIDYKTFGGNSTLKEQLIQITGGVASLKTISLPDGRSVNLEYDMTDQRDDVPGTRVLKNITIKDDFPHVNATVSSSETIKFQLNHAYFNSNSVTLSGMPTNEEIPYPYTYSSSPIPPAAILRLKLKSIDRITESSSEDYYDFEYYEGLGNEKRLPFRYNPLKQYNNTADPRPGRDVYGYANGKLSVHNHTYMSDPNFEYRIISHRPQNGLATDEIGVNKNSDPTYAMIWNIKKVINGLKGETEFEYVNLISTLLLMPSTTGIITSPVPLSNTCDGSVLKRMIVRDGIKNENDIISDYEYYDYNPNSQTSQRFISHGAASYSLYYNSILSLVYYSSMLTSTLPVNGSNHGFGYVKVTNKNSNAQILGSNEYYFSNANFNDYSTTGIPTSNYLTPNSPLYPSGALTNPQSSMTDFFKPYYEAPFTNKNYFRTWAMGLPIKTIVRDANNLIISEQTYKYSVTDIYTPSFANGSMKYLVSNYSNQTPSQYYKDLYYPISGKVKLITTVDKKYVDNTNFISNTTNYQYDSYDNLVNTTTASSKNELIEVKCFYPYHWNSTNSGPGVANLAGKNIPILMETWKTINGVKRLLDVKASGLGIANGNTVPVHYYEFLPGEEGIPAGSYTSGAASFNMLSASNGSSIPYYKKISTASEFTPLGQSQVITNNETGFSTVSLYNTEKQLLLAEVSNALLSDVAYTGFEFHSSASYDKGNWSHGWLNNVTKAADNDKLAGDYYFKFNPSNNPIDKIITSTITTMSGKDYYLTFWAKQTPPIVKEGNSVLNVQGTEFSRNGWIQYSVEFTGQGNNITLESGASTGYVDELRLYPVGAAMTSYSYKPLFGISTICDPSNRFTFYEYDAFGRKTITRNHLGEIISKSTFVQQGND